MMRLAILADAKLRKWALARVGMAPALICGLLWASTAQATCPAANQYAFNFSSQPTTTLAYGSTYTYTATSTALGSVNFTVGFQSFNLNSATVGGEVRPNISTSHNGGTGANALVVGGILAGRTANIASNTRTMVTTITFPTAVRTVNFTFYDVDFGANQFRDWIRITGTGPSGTLIPTLTTPFGQQSTSGPLTNASSSVTLGPTATPVAVAANDAVGVGVSDNASNTGNVTVTFPQPISSLQVRYGNAPLTGTETATGQQAFGIGGFSWCPMPAISLAKAVAPATTVLTDPKRFNIPGADVNYTLTVSNTGGSPLDLNSTILTDVLPPQTTFFNGDIDTVTAGTQNFIFNAGTSGLTMAPANLTYSNNGGASYGYTPAAGYDTNINGIRLNPQGTMAPNSSFTITFRAAVK
jgi:uncharacterized repeat protein (TIGR01451 family)